MDAPLWRPSPEPASSCMTSFAARVESERGVRCPDSASLQRWPVTEPERFRTSVWSAGGVVAENWGETVLRHGERMPGAEWFPEARPDFAENLLRHRAALAHPEALHTFASPPGLPPA